MSLSKKYWQTGFMLDDPIRQVYIWAILMEIPNDADMLLLSQVPIGYSLLSHKYCKMIG